MDLEALARQIDEATAKFRVEADRLYWERTPEENARAFNAALAYWLDNPERHFVGITEETV